MMRLLHLGIVSLLALGLLPAASQGAAFPAHPVKVIVPFPPGPADTFARLYAQSLSDQLGQSFVVENRTGATGTIGAAIVARSAPDGYTLLATVDLPIVKAPNLLKLNYDPAKDLQPVAIVGEDSNILAAYPGAGIKTLSDLVAAAKAKPGTLYFASAGIGSPGHLCGEMINIDAGIKLSHVPYSGAGPALTAVLSGDAQLFCGPVLALLPNIKANKLVALAVTGSKPLAQLPGVKPLADTWPGLVVTSWYGFLAPAGTPDAVTDRLQQALQKAYDNGAIRERLDTAGIGPVWITGHAAEDRIHADLAKWHAVIEKAGIKVD